MRHVVLTLADDGKSLSERMTRLYESFRRLRSTKMWTDAVVSGAATFEVTLGKNRHWHVHLHVLVCGDFIPHARLKNEWHRATGDSFIVHVTAVHNREQGVSYIADYVSKPPKLHTLTDEEIREYADALHGRRLLLTIGKKPAEIDEDDNVPDVKEPAVHVVNVNHAERAENAGVEHVGHAADILSRLSPSLCYAFDRAPGEGALPDVTPQEFKWAMHVMSEVERCFPALPDSEALERSRRYMFGEPADPPPRRFVQLQFQLGGPGTV